MTDSIVRYKEYSATVRWDNHEQAYVGSYWSHCGMFGVAIIGKTLEEAEQDFKEGMEILLEDNES